MIKRFAEMEMADMGFLEKMIEKAKADKRR